MKISEAARLAGVSVRTLRYYDKIGLLSPREVTSAGYRLYGRAELERLQEILFFRELDFPLEEIKAILSDPGYDRQTALRCHRDLLEEQRRRLDKLIALVENILKGERTMAFDAFDRKDFEEKRQAYAQEAKARWGNTDAWAESQKKTGAYGKEDWDRVNREGEAILDRFAALGDLPPESPQAQELVRAWQEHITRNYYHCTKEILSGLGQMYLADDRFRENLDSHGPGTAERLAKAIEVYCG